MSLIETTSTKDDYLKIIGEITVNMTNLEDRMATSIGVLYGGDDGANMRVTAGEPFANLLRLLDVLFRYRISDEKELKRFDTIEKALNKANDDRNTHIHGVLQFVEEKEKLIVHKHKFSKMNLGKFKTDYSPPTLETLQQLAQSITSVRLRLMNLMMSNAKAIKKHCKEAKDFDDSVIKFLTQRLETHQRTSDESKTKTEKKT
jgi:hypothetical protein